MYVGKMRRRKEGREVERKDRSLGNSIRKKNVL